MYRYVNRVFYGVVLFISIIGAAQSAQRWMGWWFGFALVAVASFELGGVVLSVHADRRRQMGERAIPARLLSAAVAAGAVSGNYFGHAQLGQAAFFAGSSLLGYTFWLIDSSARRRDALRAIGKLEVTAPIYGATSWARHPGLTYRARQLALADADLGKIGSLTAAREAVRAERRGAAISAALRERIANHVDPTMATIAVNTYDAEEVAERLRQGADYDGLTSLLAAELVPARLHNTEPVIEPQPTLQEIFMPPVVELPPAPARPVVERKPRSTWDAHRVVRMILDGETPELIIEETGVSRPSLDRIRRVTGILKLDRHADIPAKEKVRPDIIQFIRAEVSK